MTYISFIFLLQVLFLIISSSKADDADILSEVSTDRNRASSSCHKWFPADDMKDRCKVIDDATANLEEALDSIKDRDLKDSNFQSGPDHQAFSKALEARKNCLKNFLSKMDSNQGNTGLMENFRIFGIPFSKYWAFWVLTDPFEIG